MLLEKIERVAEIVSRHSVIYGVGDMPSDAEAYEKNGVKSVNVKTNELWDSKELSPQEE